jgi:hypothetical protein
MAQENYIISIEFGNENILTKFELELDSNLAKMEFNLRNIATSWKECFPDKDITVKAASYHSVLKFDMTIFTFYTSNNKFIQTTHYCNKCGNYNTANKMVSNLTICKKCSK